MPYDYSQQQAVNAGVPGAGDLRNPNFVAEGDWALFTKLETGFPTIGTTYKIPVAPNCPWRKVYLSLYPQTGGFPGWYLYGIFRATFNRRVVYHVALTFGQIAAGTPPVLPTGEVLQPTLQNGFGAFNSESGDRIMFGVIGGTTALHSPGVEMFLRADELSFEVLQRGGGSGDNTGVFFACKSMQANA